MRVVCAPDSFKESMTAAEAAAAMARGVRAVLPEADIVERPLSDGGEGFVATLAPALALAPALGVALGAEVRTIDLLDARGRPARGRFALAGDLAIIEIAQAVGLGSIAPADRDPLHSSTVGVGQLLLAALDAGARHLVVGLGGSATNDAGAGMLTALGVRLLDAEGLDVAPVPAAFDQVATIDASALDPRVLASTIVAACDVTAPLCGPAGASVVFGPQKGATPAQVRFLDAKLAHLASVAVTTAPTARPAEPADADRPGAGAAGGLGWALLAFCGATTRPGFDLVAELTDLDGACASADLVLTGEGSVDAQTLQGKAPAGVARLAARHGVPVVVLAGRVAPDAGVLLEHGVSALVPIAPPDGDLPTALREGPANLARATAATVRRFLSTP